MRRREPGPVSTHPQPLFRIMKSPLFLRSVRSCLFAGTLVTAVPLSAQSTVDDVRRPEGEPVTLSTFVVSTNKDVGYAAASTLAGSRLNTDLKDIAAPISVFTKEFIEDLGAVTVNDALEFALNTVTDYDTTGNGIVESNFQTRMRGISGAGRARNYMATGLNLDFYNTERLDFSRGPNSVLFGIGSPAGIINTTTKAARTDRDFGSVQAIVGSYGERRASLDYNESLTGNFALRVNALWQDKDGYRDFEFQDKKAGALAGTWRPFEKTTVRFEGERIEIVENRARPWTPFEAYKGWEAAGSPGAHTATTWGTAPTGTVNAAGGAIVFMSDGVWADQFVWNVGNQQFRWSDGQTPAIPGLNTPPNELDFSVVPRNANPLGAGARSNSDAKVGSLFIEQQIGRNLFIELAAAGEYEERDIVSPMNFGTYRVRQDANAFLPTFDSNGIQTGMTANPNLGRTVLISSGGFGQDSHIWRKYFREEYRATGAYNLDFKEILNDSTWGRILGHHRLAALYSEKGNESERRTGRWVNAHPTRAQPSYFHNDNRIFWGNYYDPFAPNEMDRGMQDPFAALAAAGTRPMANRAGVSVMPSLENRIWEWSRNETKTSMFAMQNYFWNDRLIGLFGWRTDEEDLYGFTQVVEPGSAAVRGFTRSGKLRSVTGDTFTRGVVFHVLPERLSLYYNRANNFQDNGVSEVIGPVGNLTSIGNRTGEGEDAGVKFWLFDGKIGASLGWYRTSDANQNVAMDGNYFVWAEAIWTAMGQTVDLAGRDTRSLESEGYEFELTANPTPQITLTFNLKNAETVSSRLFPWGKAYLAENRAAWQAANQSTPIEQPGVPAGSTIGSLIQGLDDLMVVLTAPEGRSPFQDRETTANFFGRYRFSNDSRFKGLAFGAGVQYRGESLIAYRTVTDDQPVYSPDYTLGNAMISYGRKLSDKLHLKLQLNIDNLFDLQDPQPVAGAEPTGASRATFENLGLLYNGVAYTVHLPVPRTYRLTATLSF